MTKVPGNSNLSVQKKEILNKKIFSIGYSLPITEILSKFLAEPFKKEVSEAYQSFAVHKKYFHYNIYKYFIHIFMFFIIIKYFC